MTPRRVLTVTDPLCQVAIAIFKDGSARATVTSNNLQAAVIEIPKPEDGEHISVKRTPDGCVDVWYEDIEHEPQ
jgi:hypothetical protein